MAIISTWSTQPFWLTRTKASKDYLKLAQRLKRNACANRKLIISGQGLPKAANQRRAGTERFCGGSGKEFSAAGTGNGRDQRRPGMATERVFGGRDGRGNGRGRPCYYGRATSARVRSGKSVKAPSTRSCSNRISCNSSMLFAHGGNWSARIV